MEHFSFSLCLPVFLSSSRLLALSPHCYVNMEVGADSCALPSKKQEPVEAFLQGLDATSIPDTHHRQLSPSVSLGANTRLRSKAKYFPRDYHIHQKRHVYCQQPQQAMDYEGFADHLDRDKRTRKYFSCRWSATTPRRRTPRLHPTDESPP